MNLKIQHKNFDMSPRLQQLIEKKAQKLEKILPTFADDALDLSVHVERLPRGNQYQAGLVLALPQTAIRVDQVADNVTGSVQNGFDELLRKVKKFKVQLNREQFWQRQPDWSQRTASENVREIENMINDNLDKIQNYVRRELFHKSLSESVPPGVIQPEALVDEIFLMVSSQERNKPESISFEQWTYQIARDLIDKRFSELDRDSPHVEEMASVEYQREDEILDFYQPDESLRLEDLLIDEHTQNPEELMQIEEAEAEIHKAIAKLPKGMRESFVLSVMEGFAPDEVAMITGKQTVEITRDVDRARKELRQRLRSSSRGSRAS